jgi:thioredoxin-related protein
MSFLFSRLLFCLLLPLQVFTAGWTEDYAEALQTAQASQKPMLLAFVGSEWCPWSDKLIGEVLDNYEFLSHIKDAFILVRVDFPYSGMKLASEKLKERYHVRQLPTLVLASAEGEEITAFGYLPLEAPEFAAHVKTLFERYEKLVKQLSHTDLSQLSPAELRHYYREVSSYHLPIYKEALLSMGMQKDHTPFFLLEKYSQLLKTEPKLAQKMREQIEARDPEDKEGALFQLAALDFQTLAEASGQTSKVLRPLKKHLKKVGEKKGGDVWRAHAMIAEFLFHKKGKREEILKHMQASLKTAPAEAKAQLEESFQDMQGSIQ